ncbi:MAG: T9SS type A sorting domain-containing protein [Bacteroidota bacterium]
MKNIYFAFIISMFCLSSAFSQSYENDPLEDGYIIHNGGGQEIINSYYNSVSVNKYYKETEIAPWDTLISVLQYSHARPTGLSDMVTSDLDGDSLSEIVKVWIENDIVQIAVLKPDPNLLSIDSLAEWQKIILLQKSSPALYNSSTGFLPKVVHVQSGNFDSDPQKEFVIGYWTVDGYVNLTVYDVDDTLGVVEKGSIMDQFVPDPPKIELCEDGTYLFEIECADFNSDGIDEILLGGREPANPTGWQFFIKMYSYEIESGNLIAKVKDTVYTQVDPLYDVSDLNLGAGYLTSMDKEQAIVSFYQYNPYARDSQIPDTVSFTIIPIEANDLLTKITVGSPVVQKKDTLDGDDCMYSRLSTLEAYDVNNDGLDEVISAFSIEAYPNVMTTFQIHQLQPDLELTLWADLDYLLDDFNDKADLAIGDIRAELEEEQYCPEFVMNSSLYQIRYNVDGSFKEVELIIENIRNFDIYEKSEPAKVAECDGDIRLGSPSRFSVTEILQPLVILNAPPIHFDVLNDQIYDVCLSYNENDPYFTASYLKESSQLTELETEINRDWALSTNVSASFSFWGVSVSSHFETTWGETSQWKNETATKVTVGIEANAIEDDQIYAIVVDYDIWEYPIYVNNELKGNALVVEPHTMENRWFPSKSWSGHSYIPQHEVGNILSYREYPLLSNNPMLDEKIKGDYNNSFVLNATSNYGWELQFDDFESSQTSTTKEYTRDWGASVSGWGVGFSINGSYHKEDINTQRTEVATGLNLSVHLDGINMGIGEVGYIVTPYAYWANNGALVVDYAAKPELAPQGGTPTWWQVHYEDLADPAFILPWRYDFEKGYTLEDSVKRYQTKDLQFYPANPEEGDEVTIEARIHNFSLIPTPGLIGVNFYLGDPDSGGVLLENTSGETEVVTNQAIPARGTETVQFIWIVANGTGAFPRIFAVIDADEQLVEIHENNNKSWAILNKSTGTAIETNSGTNRPTHFSLFQNYPNPFNPATTIGYQLPEYSQVDVGIYNILGQRVATLVSEKQPVGHYKVQWDASGFASGLYFYRMKTDKGFVQTKKLILLK